MSTKHFNARKFEAKYENKKIKIRHPPGITGEISKYIELQARYPVREAAIVGALGFISGTLGRAYSISQAGLNVYLIVTAQTGAGKESMTDGIERLQSGLHKLGLEAIYNYRTASDFSSGVALIKAAADKPSSFCIINESGIRFKKMLSAKAAAFEEDLKRAILDLYSKSGPNKIFYGKSYASIKDNIAIIHSPNLTIIGEGTTQTVFESLTTENLKEGFMSRFLIVTQPKDEFAMIPNFNHGAKPSRDLLKYLYKACMYSWSIESKIFNTETGNKDAHIRIGIDPKARKRFVLYEQDKRKKTRDNDEGLAELWTRAALNVLKISGILAVADNYRKPFITEEILDWSIYFVNHCIVSTSEQFGKTDVNSDDSERELYIINAINDYFKMDFNKKYNYGVRNKKLKEYPHIIPYSYLKKRADRNVLFSKNSLGFMRSFDQTIENLMTESVIKTVDNADLGLYQGVIYFEKDTEWREKK